MAKHALWFKVVVLCVAAFGLVVMTPLGTAGVASGRTTSDSSPHTMSGEAFARSEAAGRELDPAAIDGALLSAAIFHASNRARAAEGLPPLSHRPQLDKASAMHATDMAEHQYLSHDNPRDASLHTPADRVTVAGLGDYGFVAENVATAFGRQYESGRDVYERDGGISYTRTGPLIRRHTYRSFGESVVQAWMDSPGHRKNLLSSSPTALGAWATPSSEQNVFEEYYAVQVFYADRQPARRR